MHIFYGSFRAKFESPQLIVNCPNGLIRRRGAIALADSHAAPQLRARLRRPTCRISRSHATKHIQDRYVPYEKNISHFNYTNCFVFVF